MLPFHTGPDLRGDNPANVKAVILSAAGEKKKCIVNIKNLDFFTDFAFLS